MQSSDQASLQARFGIPGVLQFDEDRGLIRIKASTASAQAALYLQGAHLTHWQPAGQQPVIFLSRKSEFAPGKPLRGGVPIAFPWFATDSNPNRINGHPGPSHGFARLQNWDFVSATRDGNGLRLRLKLGPTEMSRSMGYDAFLLTQDIRIGSTLTVELTVANTGSKPMQYEEAFHTYYHVMDIHETAVKGLEPTSYIDKMDSFKTKPASGAPITFTGPVDRVYGDTEAPCVVEDGAQKRRIRIVKSNSRTTVVWNPGKELPDLGEWDWHEMVCVETVNAGKNAITLAPGESRRMGAVVSVEQWAG